jgi:hypothetical protein
MNTARLSIAPESRIPREDIVKKTPPKKKHTNDNNNQCKGASVLLVEHSETPQHTCVFPARAGGPSARNQKRFFIFDAGRVMCTIVKTGEFYMPKVKPELVCRVIYSLY